MIECRKSTPAYIGVFDVDREKMIGLGYKELKNKNHFIPKTIL